tara:strand:+ start:589 stop:1086 length:498 start_codon:yes stop_codon:yes gene_type:complete
MSSQDKNLSEYKSRAVAYAGDMKIGIVVAEWNHDITFNLLKGAKSTLLKNGLPQENLYIEQVPGSYELVIGAQMMLENNSLDAVICLGCVIQGQTKHFDFVCEAVSQGIKDVALKYNKPVVFGVLTDNNKQQSIDRSGGKLGNKGDEAAITAIQMVDLQKRLENK